MMSTVVMHAVVSADGFIADAQDQVGPLFEWYFNGDTPQLLDDPHTVIRGDRVLHLRYRVRRKNVLELGT